MRILNKYSFLNLVDSFIDLHGLTMYNKNTLKATGREGKKMQIGNEYCDNKEIFYIEDRDGYYWINGSEGYPKKDWLLPDAVQHYKSEDTRAERFISDWDAWCG